MIFLPEQLFNQKRKFKKLVKTKKCQYKCHTLTKMPIQMSYINKNDNTNVIH